VPAPRRLNRLFALIEAIFGEWERASTAKTTRVSRVTIGNFATDECHCRHTKGFINSFGLFASRSIGPIGLRKNAHTSRDPCSLSDSLMDRPAPRPILSVVATCGDLGFNNGPVTDRTNQALENQDASR
jgi:hypothetical protein